MRRGFLILLGVIIIISGIFAYRYFKTSVTNQSSIETKEFDGNLKDIKGTSIFVQGLPNNPDPQAATMKIDPNNLPVVEIVVTPSTKITRKTFRFPSDAELKKTNGVFEPAKLPREESSVNFDTLTQDFKTTTHPVGMQIIGTTNVIGQQKFTAQQITYTFPIQ